MRKASIAWLNGLLLLVVVVACPSGAAKGSIADLERFASTASSSSVVSGPVSASSVPTGTEAAEENPTVFDLEEIDPYSGNASVEVNGNVPFFTADDFARGTFEGYSPLDAPGRCGTAFALVGSKTMPDEPRGSIGMVKPSGWHTVRYDGPVDGSYLYNRCHLIGYQLAGENANERNLITGTHEMNIAGMLSFEDRVATYVERTGNHVLYRLTPVFQGDDLVARGVLLEAESVEDAGAGVRFCRWCYNVEPGVEIDYASGQGHLVGDAGEAQTAGSAATVAETNSEAVIVRTYVLNTRSCKFHHPGCPSVDDMAEHNKKIVESTHNQVVADGYDPCKRCNP